MRVPDTVSWVELIWTLGGLVGCLNHGWLLRDVLRERRRRIAAGLNGSDRLVEIERIGVKGILLAINVVMLAVGLCAMWQPAAAPQRPVTALSIVLTLALLAIGGLTNGLGFWLRWRRRVLREYYVAHMAAVAQLTKIDATTSETNERVKAIERNQGTGGC